VFPWFLKPDGVSTSRWCRRSSTSPSFLTNVNGKRVPPCCFPTFNFVLSSRVSEAAVVCLEEEPGYRFTG
jgi:hypothetical protein